MPKKKPLPPLAMPGDGTPLGDSLSQIKQIHAAGGAKSLQGFERSPGLIRHVPGAIVTTRRGKTVWRIPGKAGADLDCPPLGVQLARDEQKFITNLNKICREQRLLINRFKAMDARKHKADQRKAEVLALAEKYQEKGCNLAAFIAKKTGLSARRVRQILSNEKRK